MIFLNPKNIMNFVITIKNTQKKIFIIKFTI